MKLLLFTIFIFFLLNQSNSQVLKGEWEGSFKENGIPQSIFLEFILNADSSYSVLSYSKGESSLIRDGDKMIYVKDSPVICRVFYKFTPPDQVYLEETEAIQPSTARQDCFQKMYLKIKKEEDEIKLMGKWESNSGRCNSGGKISFKKIK